MDATPLSTYGHFDNAAGCFVLTGAPPRKWCNVHTTDPDPAGVELYAEITNIGDGPVTHRDAAGNTCQLVGYDSKQLYVRDDDSGVAFCPGGEPLATPVEEVQTRYFPDRTETSCRCEGLAVNRRTFVPRGAAVEIWTVTVENRSSRPRRLSVFAYAMFQLTGQKADGGGVWKDNHSEIHPELGGVLAFNRDRSTAGLPYNAYMICPQGVSGATGYRDFFTRSDFSLAAPRLLWGWDADNRAYRGPDCAAGLQMRLVLEPGASGRVDVVIGRFGTVAEVAALRAHWTPAAVDAAAAAARAVALERNAAFRIDTGHPDQDALLNHFAKKQMVSYLVNKSGFRDNLQNDLGLSLCDPALVMANLRRAIASQNADGSVPHSFRPWNLHHYSDKPAWLPHCVPWVIQETGDLAFLDEVIPFRDGGSATVYEHMLRALRHLAADVGAHGLCDQHFADWNDGLEPSEKTGARESVMVTQQLCLGLLEVAEIARRRGDAAVEAECRQRHAHFTALLNSVAWDGAWYVRTLCSGGYTLGSDANAEGKIFVNTQSWAVLSQTAPGERASSSMAAVDRMIENEYGFAISSPAFTAFDERIGKFSASRPYYAENGGCYNHAAGFKLIADCMLGRAEQAWRTFRKVAPGSPWNPVSNSCTEPFSFTNCYSRTREWPGMSMYAWRTGTASWFTVGLIEWILGARRHYDGLLIDPCLPACIPRAQLTRSFRGARYDIVIDNTALRGRGVRGIRLDGRPITGCILPPSRPGAQHRVEVEL